MSYRAVFFAVPTEEATEAELLSRLARATFTEKSWRIIEEVALDYGPGRPAPEGSQRHAYAAIASADLAQRSGLRYFLLGTNERGWDYWTKFELPNFLEVMAP